MAVAQGRIVRAGHSPGACARSGTREVVRVDRRCKSGWRPAPAGAARWAIDAVLFSLGIGSRRNFLCDGHHISKLTQRPKSVDRGHPHKFSEKRPKVAARTADIHHQDL
jgi:hypothetical protein